MQKLIYRTLLAAVAALSPLTALAHPGHAPEGTLNHEWQHAAWVATAVIFVVASLAIRARRRGQKQKFDD